MRFADFLRATVLLSGAAASALALVAVAAVAQHSNRDLLFATVGWWVVAAALGLWLGRAGTPNGAIAKLLGRALFASALPPLEPGRVLLNRLWPLALATVGGGALALVVPPVPGIGAGFGILFALALRRQDAAVTAVERRDGVSFYVLRTSPLQPIALQRTPGFKATLPGQEPP